MDLAVMSNRERFEWMRKRQSFLNDIVKSYTSLTELVKDKDEWFALRGIDLTKEDDNEYASIYMWLDYGEYDAYFVIPDKNGHLTISEIVLWQDDCCANTYVNPFKAINNPNAGFGVDEEDILTAIHDYS
jgi:hypothetical protein